MQFSILRGCNARLSRCFNHRADYIGPIFGRDGKGSGEMKNEDKKQGKPSRDWREAREAKRRF